MSTHTKKVISSRKSPRRQFMRQVGVLLSGSYLMARAWQISEGGMLVTGLGHIEPGQQLVLTFTIPGYPCVVVRAVVRYQVEKKVAGEPAYGLQFLNLSFEYKRNVRHFIASRFDSEKESLPALHDVELPKRIAS